MQRYLGHSLLALALLLPAASFAQDLANTEGGKASPGTTASDTIDVNHVIDAYHQAVLNHDGPRLASLFLPQGSLWLNVLSDETYANAKAKSPDAQKVRVGSYMDFQKLVSNTKINLNPTHTHLQIKTDGTIASVYFDYIFLIDGKATNQGNETWILVKGSEGWRIAAITYSSSPPKL